MVRRLLPIPIASLAAAASAQIHLGLHSDFQDGTLMDWGGPNCSLAPDGGPLGAGDAYAHTTADGSGQGGNLAMFNVASWTGNYQAAGVTAITMMVNNFNSVSLSMRIVLFDGATFARWTSTDAAILPANSGWSALTFHLDEASLTRVLGSSGYQGMITNVNRLMIRHDAGSPSSGGTPIVGAMGVDDIRAVPEPATLLAIGVGVIGLARRRVRRGD